MHIVLAPNAFKGNLTATEACHFIANGLKKSKLDCRLTIFPIADGGDGTAILIARKLECEMIHVPVHDPLGRHIEAAFGWHDDTKTAVIEISEASGLRLLQTAELVPLEANTFGTGELLRTALDKGAESIIVGVGGSATTDGGSGLLNALGVRFLDANHEKITTLPVGLTRLKTIDVSYLDNRLKECKITVLCDVKNPLLGKNGAAVVFGPQKGANQVQVNQLEDCLRQLSDVAQQSLNFDMASMDRGGAAGGVAAALSAFAGAELVSGIDYFLDIMGFETEAAGADLLITAEGSLDRQTLEGKGPFGVAVRAKVMGIPAMILAGSIPLELSDEIERSFDAVFSIGSSVTVLDQAIQNTGTDLIRTACQLGNLIALVRSGQ